MTPRQHAVQIFTLHVLRHVTTVDICLITDLPGSLMVGLCGASNRHVLVGKTRPTEEGSVTLQRFFFQPGPDWSLRCALTHLLFVLLHRSVQSLPDKSKQEALRVDLVDAIRRKQNT